MTKLQGERIVKWNEDRGLIKTIENVNIEKEISFVIEEMIEMVSELNSEEARDIAENISKEIMTYSNGKLDRERIVDAACDGIVFLTGLIRKIGYNPDMSMDECIKHIESRTGKIIDGKFVKDRDIITYEPNYNNADLIK